MKISNIAGVEAVTAGPEQSDTAVVMFHGYGANMHDLFPLWQLWDNKNISWYFPNGVSALPMGYYEGRSWFSIDMAGLELAMREGRHRDMSTHVPPEFDTTLKQLENFLRTLAWTHKKLIVGGFSQGGMCAYHLAMIKDLPIDALILLSTNMLADSRLPQAARGLPFYQSHGFQDPILSMEGAELLERKLQSLGFKGSLHTFQGGHEIPPSVISGVKNFIHDLVN